MATDHRAELARIQRFDQLVRYLRDEMGWPIASDDFEELTFDYSAEELGINAENAAKIQEIKRLRPLSAKQPWGIFFVKFEPKSLPVVALRRVLSQVAIKKRASANAADRAGWEADDLLFVSNYGQGGARQISFAHFSRPSSRQDLPTLKVLGWDNQDTPLHLDAIAKELTENLAWPLDEADVDEWRRRWRGAFTLGHREVITTAERLSIRLAELAGSIRDRIRSAIAIESSRGPLTRLMKAFQESLVHDLDAEGFADMYAQTISYGLLSSRIADPSKKTADDFAAHMRTSPFLRELMQTFLKIGGRQGKADGAGIDFDELGVADVVELLDGANMEAVLRDFGDRNRQEDPVIHFFEGFLQAYDKRIRKDRGVFYTPQPVVSYIVRSVHELLQSEFGLEDGLASTITWGEMLKKHPGLKLPSLTDRPNEMRTISPNEPFIQILDPATGTATFLVEVIDSIYHTLARKWKQQRLTEAQQLDAWNDYVPKHLLPRLHAFELMMAPYAIAHMKIGLKLAETGYRFDTEERARIYLTNALEPWVQQLPLIGFEALAHEAAAVNEIKRNKRFTVVIGNPPYAGHSVNNQVASIVEKVHEYKSGYLDLKKPGQAKWLQDDYVKFLRFAEWQVERSLCGMIGFITNHAWLDNPTFKGMRRHVLNTFDQISVLDLHGNANKLERAADGSPDKNVFAIKQGVAVALLRRTPENFAQAALLVRRADLFGSESFKYESLSTHTATALPTVQFRPLPPELMFVKLDDDRKREYDAYVSIPQLMGENGDPAPGIVTTHDEFAVSLSKEEQIKKVEALLGTKTEAEARKLFTLCSQNQWIYSDAKRALLAEDWRKELIQILYRPFDKRWTVYSRYVAVHRRERVSRHLLAGHSLALISCRQRSVQDGWAQAFCTMHPIESTAISNKTKEINYVFPLWLEPEWPETRCLPNFSNSSLRQLVTSTGLSLAQQSEYMKEDGRGDLKSTFGPRDVFDFVYSLLHSNQYRERYADFLKSDFARVPLTPSKAGFQALVKLGAELVSLHLLESPKLDCPITEFIGSRSLEVEKISWSGDTVWLDKAQTTGFKGLREQVWNFHIGGYQVCEKWLKDRKGRTLSKDDIAHYQKIVVASSETIRVMSEIDVVIEQHGGWPGAFQSTDE